MDSIEGEELSTTTDGCAYGASRGVGERCVEGHWLEEYVAAGNERGFRLLEGFVLSRLGFRSRWFTHTRPGRGRMIMVYANICWSRKEAKESARKALDLVLNSSREQWLEFIEGADDLDSGDVPTCLADPDDDGEQEADVSHLSIRALARLDLFFRLLALKDPERYMGKSQRK